MPYEDLIQTFISSSAIPPGRTVWEWVPASPTSDAAIIFLDGEFYLEGIGVVDLLQKMIDSEKIPRVPAFFVSNQNKAARAEDFTCNPEYPAFLTQDVLPALLTTHTSIDPQRIILVGLSLSGLAAANVSLVKPHWFQATITQSASFWWNREQFVEKLPAATSDHGPYWISVGDQESEENVYHATANLQQEVSQIDSCLRTHQQMQEKGFRTRYRMFSGGHDYDSWREDLLYALPWAFQQK